MNVKDLQNLDPKNIGSWPAVIRALVLLGLSAAILGAGYWFDTRTQIGKLEREVKKEEQLKQTFEIKQRKAVNLDPLRRQLQEMKQTFGDLLRLLPNKTEIEGLLVDISQSGLAAGLEFDLFKPAAEKPEEFYAVQPIRIQVTGTYHQLAEYVSAVAGLPRIVTQHDITMAPLSGENENTKLSMGMTARTYRYLEEEEIDARSKAQKKKKKGKRK
ncbi:MAG: type 4a pilus biogenesis protein PilO [Gammaproteobacteria bacterium]|nr:type 4a pilus biogenesis protein PilO [Gammaproteobacteria bacterium]MDH3411913.1 type 4a pilus biogenesis protein PilO [Gammaproteobacteria bacterium]